MELEITKDNILENLLRLSRDLEILCFDDNELPKEIVIQQDETLILFSILCRKWTIGYLDELIINDYEKVLNTINLFVKRLVIALNSTGYREKRTEIEKSFIPRGRMFVLELSYAYTLNEDYISKIFTKPEIEEIEIKKGKPLAKTVWNSKTRFELINELGFLKMITKGFPIKNDQNFIVSQIMGVCTDTAKKLINKDYNGNSIEDEDLQCSQYINQFKLNKNN